ncbi:tRNA-splicing endonuclease subunit Sen54 [Holothuria leucospilota]|uniref:tRNA-splicing endonuclease subunit Sen54 n=1 Tax=Holothuria leucospilota TaxID=206669 RepID=A0A9Q1C2U2_HOLLE|nr:tRNA-splicing endonuclease subunit Sen54 [Holothuria leucospilota]
MEQLENTDVLGPQELAFYHKLDPKLPHNGIKAAEPIGSMEEAIHLSQVQAQQREMLDEKRVARFGNLSIGDWNADLELIEVKSEKGKFWQTMGYNSGSKKYLYPEEGLFLMELNMFELLHQGVPLSLQQAFELLIPSEFSIEEYQTYAHLMRLGYITTRFTQRDITEYEHRIRLYQRQNNRQQRARKKVQVWFDQIAKKTSIPNNSDSGELTDESYYSSSSGNGFSLKSAGDLNNKVKLAQQEKEEKEVKLAQQEKEEKELAQQEKEGEEKWSDEATGSEDNSSVYSDGPVSQMSPPAQENYDSDFNHSVVNLLDYHQRNMSSGSEQNLKVLKRKHLSWYMTMVNSGGETSSASFTQMPPAKVRRESPATEKVQRSGKKEKKSPSIPMHVIEEKDLKMDFSTKDYFQSSDLGPSEKSESDSLIDIDEFLQAVVKQINQGKKRKQRCITKRPYSVWNFSEIRLPDMATNSFIQDLPVVSALPKTLDEKEDKVSVGNLAGENSDKESGNSLDEEVSGFNSVESVEGNNSITALLKKGENILEKTAKSFPTNWMEYKAMLKMPEKDLSELLASPVGHLWNGPVQPLVRPSDSVNTDLLLKKLQVIQSSERKKMSRSLSTPCKEVKITFNVYLPDSRYKKTCPGPPAFCVVIYNVQDPVPDLGVQMGLLNQAKTVPLLFSIVDNADITFCCFRDVEIPLGIT